MKWRHAQLVLAFCCVLMLVGCGDDDPAPSGPKTGGGKVKGPPDDRPKVWLIAVDETNLDSFPGPLADMDPDEHGEPPFELRGGEILIHQDRPEGDDSLLTLGGSAKSVRDCRLLIVRSTAFSGKGRLGLHVRYYAFPGLEAALALDPPGKEGDVTHDPNDSEFIFAIQSVRLLPPGAKELKLSIDGQGQLTATLAGKSVTVAAGKRVDVSDRQQTVRVTEKALIVRATKAVAGDPFGDNDDPTATGPPTMLSPKRDHGKITFQTTLSVENVGATPFADESADASEGL